MNSEMALERLDKGIEEITKQLSELDVFLKENRITIEKYEIQKEFLSYELKDYVFFKETFHGVIKHGKKNHNF